MASPTTQAALERLTTKAKESEYDDVGVLTEDLLALLANHATQAARIAHLEERDALLQQAVLDRCAERKAARARVAELEGKLGEVLAATTQGLSGQWVFDHEDPEALLSGANDLLSAIPPAAPSLPADVPVPWEPRCVDMSIAELEAWDKAGLPIDEIRNWTSFGEAVACVLGQLKWMRYMAAIAPFADRVAGEEEADEIACRFCCDSGLDEDAPFGKCTHCNGEPAPVQAAVAEQTDGEA